MDPMKPDEIGELLKRLPDTFTRELAMALKPSTEAVKLEEAGNMAAADGAPLRRSGSRI